jgi:hypothetical protein
MAHAPKPAVPDIRVPDAAEAMRKTMDFGRRLLGVPKSEIIKEKSQPKRKLKRST